VFLIVLLAIVAVFALLSWVLVRKRERTDYGSGYLGGGHESGGHLGGGHGF
jgi:preprotein translocase subunit SecG